MNTEETLVTYLYARVESLEAKVKELEEEIQSLKNK
jgi:hypothetical protein